MSSGNGGKLVNRPVVLLAVISIAALIGGVVVAYIGGNAVGAVIAIATGAGGGIVAIVIKVIERDSTR